MAVEDGHGQSLPQSIQTLLAARLDRLEATERGLVERAAVIGKEFWRSALVHRSSYQLGRDTDVEHFAATSLELASADDIASQAWGRAVQSKLLAANGDHEAAYARAREAVKLSRETDDLYMHGQVLMALAEVLHLAGRDADSIPVLRQAVAVSERKGTSSPREGPNVALRSSWSSDRTRRLEEGDRPALEMRHEAMTMSSNRAARRLI